MAINYKQNQIKSKNVSINEEEYQTNNINIPEEEMIHYIQSLQQDFTSFSMKITKYIFRSMSTNTLNLISPIINNVLQQILNISITHKSAILDWVMQFIPCDTSHGIYPSVQKVGK